MKWCVFCLTIMLFATIQTNEKQSLLSNLCQLQYDNTFIKNVCRLHSRQSLQSNKDKNEMEFRKKLLEALKQSQNASIAFDISYDYVIHLIQFHSLKNVIFLQSDLGDNRRSFVKMIKEMSSVNVRSTILNLEYELTALDLKPWTIRNTGVFAQLSSLEMASALLNKGSKTVTEGNNRWFIRLKTDKDIDKISKDLTESSSVNLPLNSQVYFVLTERGGQSSILSVHEVYQKSRAFPLESGQVGFWTVDTGLVAVQQSIWKRRNNLQGVHLLVTALEDLPFIDIQNNGDVTGFSGDVWNALQFQLGFQYSVVRSIDGGWGSKTENGSFNGMVGMLERKEVDVAVASLFASLERSEVADFTYGLVHSSVNIYIKTPTSEMGLQTFTGPFSQSMWLLTLIFVMVSGLFIWICKHFGTESADGCLVMFDAYGFFCQQGASSTPINCSGRVVYLSILVCFLVIASVYSGALASYLTVTKVDLPFQNLYELYHHSSYRVGTLPATMFEDYFKNAKSGVNQLIFKERYISVQSSDEGLTMSQEDPSFGFMYGAETIDYLSGGACQLTSVGPPVMYGKIVFMLTKNSPFTGLFNYYLKMMEENGQFEKLWTKWKPSKSKDCLKMTKYSGITLGNVQSAFWLLNLSFVVAILAFVSEKLFAILRDLNN